MSVETQVVWAPSMPKEQLDTIANVAASMGQQTQPATGSTDPITGNFTVTRHWVDMPAAETWINYVGEFTPVSASIIT